jgi:TRAP-type uncharacterized transport system fused permease subunit
MRDAAGPSLVTVLRRDWPLFLPIIVLVWGVLRLDRPAYAGALACAALLPVALYRDRSLSRVVSSLIAGLRSGWCGS